MRALAALLLVGVVLVYNRSSPLSAEDEKEKRLTGVQYVTSENREVTLEKHVHLKQRPLYNPEETPKLVNKKRIFKEEIPFAIVRNDTETATLRSRREIPSNASAVNSSLHRFASKVSPSPVMPSTSSFNVSATKDITSSTVKKETVPPPQVHHMIHPRCHGTNSCRGKCVDCMQVASERYSCMCDRYCRYFGDCCADYLTYCVKDHIPNPTVWPENSNSSGDLKMTEHSTRRSSENKKKEGNKMVGQVNESRQAEKISPLKLNVGVCNDWKGPAEREMLGTWKCVHGGHLRLWLISSCPESWPRDKVFYNCTNIPSISGIPEALLNDTISSVVPVYSDDGTPFQNQYCALCHGKTNITRYNHVLRKSNTTTEVSWWPLNGEPRRNCIASIDSCPGPSENRDNLCTTDIPGIVWSYNTRYRNTHCAQCHGQRFVFCAPKSLEMPMLYMVMQRSPIIMDFKPPSIVHFRYPLVPYLRPPLVLMLPSIHSVQVIARVTAVIVFLKNKNSLHTLKDSSWLIKTLKVSFALKNYRVKNVTTTMGMQPNDKIVQFYVEDEKEEMDVVMDCLMIFNEFLGNVSSLASRYDIHKVFKQRLFCWTERTLTLEGNISRVNISRLVSCLPNTSISCNVTVRLAPHEYTLYDTGFLYIYHSKAIYNTSQYTILNGTMYVCSKIRLKKASLWAYHEMVLNKMSTIGMSFSIASLVFMLMTYFLFNELRTHPGIHLMNLSIALLMAQLMWLTLLNQTHYPKLCTAIAVALQYLYLAAFTWISVISFSTWKAFNVFAVAKPVLSQLICRCAVGWLLPLVFVSICFALDKTNILYIGYGNADLCWITDQTALLSVFLGPIALSILWNVVFFILTIRAIAASANQSKMVLCQKKQTVHIYARIGSLMGFTWVFGFAALGWKYLVYPFVFFNSMQGVYIAAAFALNKKARSLYAARFKCYKTRGGSRKSNITKTYLTTSRQGQTSV